MRPKATPTAKRATKPAGRAAILVIAFAALASSIATRAAADPSADRQWATRIPCELQTAAGASLPDMDWLQGTTPLVSLDQFRSGRAVNAESNVTAVLRFAPTATSSYWVSVTNYTSILNGYLIQMPTIGTNTPAGKPWYYTALFFRDSKLYWTGSGKLSIAATTATGNDGLVWQDISSFSGVSQSDLVGALEPIKNSLAEMVTSVNGMTGDVVITAASIGALTSAPPQSVTSVNGQTGDVVIAEQDLSEYVRKDSGNVVDYPSFYLSGSHPKTLPAISRHSFTFQPSGLMYAWYGGFSSRYTRMDDTGVHAEKTDDGVIIDWAHYGANGIGSPRGTFLLPDNDGGTLATLDDMPPPTPLPEGIITNHAESVSFGSIELGGVTRGAWPEGLTQEEADARYFSTVPGWYWQGSQAVVTNDWTGTPHAPAVEGAGDNCYHLIPYTTTRLSETGVVIITSSHYIVGVGADWHLAKPIDAQLPTRPMEIMSQRVDNHTWELSAYCSQNPLDGNPFYFAYASNIVVMTYDRIEMTPGLYTNDAAGVVSRVDDAPLTIAKTGERGENPVTVDDERRAVNAGTMKAYVDARKTEIADKAWRRTPSGRDALSQYTVTIDQPLIQQGQISYLNSGDYHAMSAEGGDWYNVTTGSVWRLGPSGSVAFEILSTNRLLHIQGFHVGGGYATIDISTNWITAGYVPEIEFSDSIVNPQWLMCPEQNLVNHTTYWRGVCPAVAGTRFFRVVVRNGDGKIISHYAHEFRSDIVLFGRRYKSLAELKQALEEVE